MIAQVTCRSRFRLAGVALCALAALAPGCGRPTDETWLRFLGFKQGGSTISVLKDGLREETSTTVDAELQNGSLNVGQKFGTGIFVNRARIDYRMSGFSPPAADFPLNLYLAPPASGTPTTGTLTAFPLVPASLKNWLKNTGAFDDAESTPVVELTARVTFYGVTDDGATIETAGSIMIALTNTGSAGTRPTVTVKWARDVSRAATGATGAFTVYRNSNFTNSLTVDFTMSGTPAVGVNYTITTPVVIPASANNIEIKVTPIGAASAAGATGTVTLTLVNSSSYTVGAPASASLKITD